MNFKTRLKQYKKLKKARKKAIAEFNGNMANPETYNLASIIYECEVGILEIEGAETLTAREAAGIIEQISKH